MDRSRLSEDERRVLTDSRADGRRYVRGYPDRATLLFEYRAGRAKRVGSIPAATPEGERRARVRDFLGTPEDEERRVVEVSRLRGLSAHPEGVTEEDCEAWRQIGLGPYSKNADSPRVHVRTAALRPGDIIRVRPGWNMAMQRRQIVGRVLGFRREQMAFSDRTHQVARVEQADGTVVSVALYDQGRDNRPVRQVELYRPGREPRAFRSKGCP